MSMNENEFEYSGKTYIAIDRPYFGSCKNCAFEFTDCSIGRPSCLRNKRIDERSVIFIEKPQEVKLFDDRDCVTL